MFILHVDEEPNIYLLNQNKLHLKIFHLKILLKIYLPIHLMIYLKIFHPIFHRMSYQMITDVLPEKELENES